VNAGARFSPDRLYRYHLWRVWEPSRRSFVLIGLNPSTADETQDDPTIRRCINFAKREGCGRLDMLNLFAWRSTDPAALRRVSDPVGPENDEVIGDVIGMAGGDVRVVAAWGGHGSARGDRLVREINGWACGVWCFGTTKDGSPRHPLYLRNDAALVVYRGRP
jgi:hypothetical protein